MSDQFPRDGRPDFRQRLLSEAERDQDEIRDFLNAKGSIGLAVIVAVIVVFFLLQAFTA